MSTRENSQWTECSICWYIVSDGFSVALVRIGFEALRQRERKRKREREREREREEEREREREGEGEREGRDRDR